MKTEVNKLPGSQVEIKITVPTERVGSVLDTTLSQAAGRVEVGGFRKGKAPKHLTQKKLNMDKVYESTLNTVITEAYATAVKEHHLKPIVSPRIELLQFDKEAKKELIFKAIIAERPKVELKDYKQALADFKAKPPEKSPSSPEVLETVLKTAKLEVPQLLTDTEVNRMLSRLVDQTARLSLTVEQYLESQGKTAESLREEYRRQAETSLKTEFVLDEIANLEKIEVKDEEINEAIKANPDEKARIEFEKPENRWYTISILKRGKTLQRLRDLAKKP